MTNLVMVNIVALTSISFAGYLCINGIEGWGWFLFIGLCCAQYGASTEDREEEK